MADIRWVKRTEPKPGYGEVVREFIVLQQRVMGGSYNATGEWIPGMVWMDVPTETEE